MKISENLLRAEGNNFTLVRLVLASSVIYSHAFWAMTGLDDTDEASSILGISLGGAAVEAFFFLSGFLVYSSLQRMGSVRQFCLARLLRLWPGLAVCVIVTVLVGWIASNVRGFAYFGGLTEQFLIGNLTFVKASFALTGVSCPQKTCDVNGSLWSLPWEVRCYIILALLGLVSLASPRWMARLVLPATLVFTFAWDIEALHEFMLAHLGHGIVYQIDVLHRLWPTFSLGIAAYIFRRRLRLSWLILGGLFLLNLLLIGTEVSVQARSIFIGYGVLCAGLATASRGPVSARWPDYSYGIYIYAFPVMDVIHVIWPAASRWVLAAGTLAATLPIAALSWHLVEKPTLGVYRRWANSSRDRGSIAPGATPAVAGLSGSDASTGE